MEKDLKWIKKHYGEKMMHLCRELFPSLLETDGLLTSILESHFPHCRHLADDIVREGQTNNFVNYIKSQVPKDEIKKEEEKKKPEKSAVELMKEAGYTLYPECRNENEIQAFKKYYEKKEELCTFKGDRLDTCRVWFAVKDNVDEIKRENFRHPDRQDEYGTSVISIQFSRTGNRLSIKNRYNHTVENPDNTFNNSLDNIIPGLADAFEADYGVRDRQDRNSRFELSRYVFVDEKFYPYNFESNNVYYCENNIVIDLFKVKTLPSHQKLLESFVVDSKNNTIEKYMPDDGQPFQHEDCFDETIGKIANMNYEKDGIHIVCENGDKVFIGFDDRNRITAYSNENLKKVGDEFLCRNESLNSLILPNVKECGSRFLYNNLGLKEIDMPSLEKCGRSFLNSNKHIQKVGLPNLRKCGDGFMQLNLNLEEISLPSLEKCGANFIGINDKLKTVDLPKLTECGDGFCAFSKNVSNINMPNLEICGHDFFSTCTISRIDFPSLVRCEDNFFAYDSCVTEVNLPNLNECGVGFLWRANQLQELELPNLRRYDSGFLGLNKSLKRLSLPSLERSNSYYDILGTNNVLEELDIPNNFKSRPEFRRLVDLVRANSGVVDVEETTETKEKRGVFEMLKRMLGMDSSKDDDREM